MGVVTEPPWLNMNSGVAARNGTNSHTISFGFTSTAGSLLVVLVYGPVTHTAAGWTEQLEGVTSGELSVFLKTSTGDSSITVTHNASNFPVVWTAYEFNTGSAYTTGVMAANTASDTFPALTGLPGDAEVIIAARGRIPADPSNTQATTTWDSPFVEDADLFVADDGSTDGAYMTVGHQINYTGTSITPTATTTYAWGTVDRQHAVFALNVVQAATDLTTDADPQPIQVVPGSGSLAVALATTAVAAPILAMAGDGALAIDRATAVNPQPVLIGVANTTTGLSSATNVSPQPVLLTAGSGNLHLATPSNLTVSLWNGSTEIPVTVSGVWTGSQVVPVTLDVAP